MEGRGWRPRSPERQRPAARKVPVVYYLTRSRHLEHPHFVEVPVASPEGLYLRDVINHLNMVRGKGMASMYSWSCKRSYKNGFVWHDLAEDDLVLPATDGEYILKGSELVDQSSPGQFYHGSNDNQKQQSMLKESTRQPLPREPSYPSSPPSVTIREARSRRSPSVPPPDEDDTPSPCRGHSTGTMSPEMESERAQLPASGSASPAEFRIHKPTGCMDAATQTDDLGRRSSRRAPEMRKKSLSTDHDAVVREISEYHQSHPRRSAELQGMSRELLSQCPTPMSIPSTRGKSESLESLIRADKATNSFRIIEEDDIIVPTCPKLKPTNVLMQLITCGSLSVKEHENIGIVQAYKPRFPNLKFPSPLISRTMMMGELDYLSENPRLMGMKLDEKEYFSGSIIETKMQRDVPAERYSALKRSSSYNAERSSETLDCSKSEEDATDTSRSRCLPRTPLLSSLLHPKNETLKSPISDCRRSSSAKQDCDLASGDGSRRFTDAASARTDSFRKEGKLVKIEES